MVVHMTTATAIHDSRLGMLKQTQPFGYVNLCEAESSFIWRP